MSNMYKIELVPIASEAVIKQAIQMDHEAFQVSDWITEDDAKSIYLSKKDCLILLTKEDKPVGFVTIFPLNSSVPIKAIEKNKPIYKLLTHDILNDLNTDVLYCHCFLLLPQFRGKGLIYKLYEGLRMWMEQKGTGYSALYADAVSGDGRRCLERLGFISVHSFGADGDLYKADKQNVINAIDGYGNLSGY